MRLLLVIGFGVGLVSVFDPPAGAEQPPVDYLRDVKPILAARCYTCHGGLKQKSGLRLDTAASIRKGGLAGPAIIPGKSDESLLFEKITDSNDTKRMPPESEGEGLKPNQIALIKAWIDQGATGPADEKPEADPKDHWAFRPPLRPPVPGRGDPPVAPTQRHAWARNPIDAFIAVEHAKHGLTPQPPADKAILLRRVYLDLIGLPPTRDELQAFLADISIDAYEKVVDRLLSSKHYGERWGRHWMDIWRYSDWWGLGAEVRNSQKHIWHWRDWIVESLNADKGYDQMLREMLAADELYPTDLDKLRGTGFLARQYFKFNRNSWMEETVEHTSKAFLGLTMNCSRCHDHKYDPISQADYYRFRAFFEPYQIRTDQLPGEPDFEKDGLPRVFDCNLDAPTYLFVRGDEKRRVKDKPLAPSLPPILALDELKIQSVTLPAEAHQPGLRSFILEDHLRAAERQLTMAREGPERARKALAEIAAVAIRPPAMLALAVQLKALVLAEKTLAAAETQPAVLRARAAADQARQQQPPPTNAAVLAQEATKAEKQAALLKAEEDVARAELELFNADSAKKAEAGKKLAAARDSINQAKKALEAPGEAYTPLRGALKTLESNVETEASRNKPFPATSTGRRSALAKWLTDRQNPLTARVAVNHIWMRHMGKPLVPTVFDFGRKGTPPTHPELLDWLAVEFMENGWSMKHVHRLIVTSNTYRMSSSSAELGARSAEPKSTPSSALRVPRSVDPENRYYWRMNPLRMEAQVVRDSLLYLSGDLDLTLGGPTIPAASESRRRSLYFFHSHNEHQKFLSMFDDASVLECYRRAESIVPQQALALSNSKLAFSAAEKIAARLNDIASDKDFIRAAFETILAAPPTAAELAECEQALKELTELATQAKATNPAQRARVNLVHALVNHNDFVTIR